MPYVLYYHTLQKSLFKHLLQIMPMQVTTIAYSWRALPSHHSWLTAWESVCTSECQRWQGYALSEHVHLHASQLVLRASPFEKNRKGLVTRTHTFGDFTHDSWVTTLRVYCLWMPVVSEIVRLSKSNLHYMQICDCISHARKVQLLDNCIPGPPNVYVRVIRPFRFFFGGAGPRDYFSTSNRHWHGAAHSMLWTKVITNVWPSYHFRVKQ